MIQNFPNLCEIHFFKTRVEIFSINNCTNDKDILYENCNHQHDYIDFFLNVTHDIKIFLFFAGRFERIL